MLRTLIRRFLLTVLIALPAALVLLRVTGALHVWGGWIALAAIVSLLLVAEVLIAWRRRHRDSTAYHLDAGSPRSHRAEMAKIDTNPSNIYPS